MKDITIYTTNSCSYCFRAKSLLTRKGLKFNEIDVSNDRATRAVMTQRARGRSTVPQIFIGDEPVGGCDELYDLERAGQLDLLVASA